MFNPSSEYRLNDLIKGYIEKNYNLYPRIHPSPQLYCDKWNKSIGCEYISRTKKHNDYKTLNKIVFERNFNKTFMSYDSMTIHLRLGDVLEFPYYLNLKCMNGCHWVRPLDFYKKLKIPKSVNNVYMVYNQSFRLSKKSINNIIYINNVKKIIESKNKKIIDYKGIDADDDFLFLTRSKYFVKSGGGFSNLAAIVGTSLYNNQVF